MPDNWNTGTELLSPAYFHRGEPMDFYTIRRLNDEKRHPYNNREPIFMKVSGRITGKVPGSKPLGANGIDHIGLLIKHLQINDRTNGHGEHHAAK